MVTKKTVPRKRADQGEELLTYWDRISAYYEQNQQKILNIAIAVVVVLTLVLIYTIYKRNQNEQANIEFGAAIKLYHDFMALDKESKKEEFQKTAQDFAAIHQKYSGTNVGKLAMLYEAHSYYQAKDLERAASLYKDAALLFPPGSDYRIVALLSVGESYESLGKFEDALQAYELALKAKNEGFKQKARLGIARITLLQNESAKALSLYQDFKKDYPDSPWLEEVDMEINRLQAELAQKKTEKPETKEAKEG